MSYQTWGRGALDYAPCTYGASRLQFRGPACDLDAPYLAFLGGTETYGKFLTDPFATLVAEAHELGALNLGCVNAGPDVYWTDLEPVNLSLKARATVVQVMGATNVSNRYYTVHPRRNDRFIKVTPALRSLYPHLDLTEVHFTRHLIQKLRSASVELFEPVREELQAVWLSRMEMVLARCGGPILLLCISDHTSEHALREPLFVTREMVESLRGMVTDILEVTPSEAALGQGPRELVFHSMEAAAASKMMSASVHREIAHKVSDRLMDILRSP